LVLELGSNAQNTKELTVPTLEDSERGKILGPWLAELTPKILFFHSHPKRRPVKKRMIY